MSEEMTEAEFAALLAFRGLRLDAAQLRAAREAHAQLRPKIAKAAAPLPREAEPSLIFRPEQG